MWCLYTNQASVSSVKWPSEESENDQIIAYYFALT